MIVSAILFLLLPFGAFSADTPTVSPSRIRRATLFTDQALITREANILVNKGLNEIHIGIDAFQADPDSVTARVFGDGEIHGVQFRRISLKEASQENIRVIEQKIETLEYDLQANANNLKTLENKERFLDSVIDFAKTQIPVEIKTSYPGTEDLAKTLGFIGGQFETIYAARLELKQKSDALAKDIQVLRNELASLTEGRGREMKTIEILFHAGKEQTIRIEAAYLVHQAFWEPLYKVDAPYDLSGVDLTLFAKIRQKTGEDWSDIQLSVSNATPLKGAAMPDLTSWMLDIPRPPAPMEEHRVQKMTAPMAAAPRKKEMVMADDALSEEAAGFVEARKTELPLAFEYAIPRNVSIESQDKETILPLSTRTLKGDFQYFAVPKRNLQVFLAVTVTADKELLPGFMNIHFGSHFVGKTILEEKTAGDSFELNLGVDREIKVKREKTMDKIKETFFGKIERGTVVRNMAFRLTVENLKDKNVLVNLMDHVPVSATDKIKIKDLKIQPQPDKTNYRDREGVLLWKLPLKAGESKVIDISFELSYPKDEPVSGL